MIEKKYGEVAVKNFASRAEMVVFAVASFRSVLRTKKDAKMYPDSDSASKIRDRG